MNRRNLVRKVVDEILIDPAKYTYHLRETEDGEWYWYLESRNGEEIANSEQSYSNKEDCKHGLRIVRNSKEVEVLEKQYRKPPRRIHDV